MESEIEKMTYITNSHIEIICLVEDKINNKWWLEIHFISGRTVISTIFKTFQEAQDRLLSFGVPMFLAKDGRKNSLIGE